MTSRKYVFWCYDCGTEREAIIQDPLNDELPVCDGCHSTMRIRDGFTVLYVDRRHLHIISEALRNSLIDKTCTDRVETQNALMVVNNAMGTLEDSEE